MPDVVEVRVGLDPKALDKELKRVTAETEKTKRGVRLAVMSSISALRRTMSLTILMTEAVTGALDATFRYAIEMGLMTVELMATISVAESLTLVGAIKAGVQLAAIVSIGMTISKLIAGNAEQAAQMGRVSNFLRALSMSF